MDKTEVVIPRFVRALPATGYDLGILGDTCMYRLESVPAARILRMLPYLKYRNANGAHIYIRPTGESAYTLLDDLTTASIARLSAEGYDPAAVVETSPVLSRNGYATRSRFPKTVERSPRRCLPSSLSQTAVLPIGAGLDAHQGSQTVSRNTAARGASICLPGRPLAQARHLPLPICSDEQLLASKQKAEQERTELRLSLRGRTHDVKVSLSLPLNATPTSAAPPQQTWHSR